MFCPFTIWKKVKISDAFFTYSGQKNKKITLSEVMGEICRNPDIIK